MPRRMAFSAEDQKKIDEKVAYAMKQAEKARKIVEHHRQLGNLPPAFPNNAFPAARRGPRMPVSSTNGGINIVGGTIGNAVIGSDKPVSFEQQMSVFGKGAERTKYKILGGDFNQANFGGSVTTYNNAKSTIGATDNTTGISTEDLLLNILLKGVSTTQLTQLLEKGYSLANITFSLPDTDYRRDRMIEVLLQ